MKVKYFLNKFFSQGFTLIELLIVIAILGILAAGILVAINPVAQLAKARDAGRKTAVKQINDAVVRYLIVNGSYPDAAACNSSIDWCNSIQSNPWIPSLAGSGELKKVPIDPVNISNSNTELLYYYITNGSDYCIQASFETNMTGDPNLKAYDSTKKVWKLRYGPNGPCSGLCNVPAC